MQDFYQNARTMDPIRLTHVHRGKPDDVFLDINNYKTFFFL